MHDRPRLAATAAFLTSVLVACYDQPDRPEPGDGAQDASAEASSEADSTAASSPGATDDPTDPTTTSATGSMTSQPDTTDTVDSTITDAPTTDPTATDPGDSTDGTDTEAATVGACVQGCFEASDCCDHPECQEHLGTYPYAITCEEGTCVNHGCATADECSFDGVLADQVCIESNDLGLCYTTCASDQDCEDHFLAGFTCTGDGGVHGSYCEAPPCDSSADCGGPPYACDDGVCVFSCTGDEDCDDNGSCDVASGQCVCADDSQCATGYVCKG